MTDEPERNAHGQPVGPRLDGWARPPHPTRVVLQGRTCRLEPLDTAGHASALWEAYADDSDGAMWTYLPDGPHATRRQHDEWIARSAASSDPLFFAVIDGSDQAVGLISYLRIDIDNGVIEVGYVIFSPRLQRTVAATEAQFLLARHAFALGYRRYEWKCDALNAPSRAAALRLGFRFEGIFRKARVARGRSRDTSWFSIVDDEWPTLAAAYARWLDPANFDADGRQHLRLSDLTAAAKGAAPVLWSRDL